MTPDKESVVAVMQTREGWWAPSVADRKQSLHCAAGAHLERRLPKSLDEAGFRSRFQEKDNVKSFRREIDGLVLLSRQRAMVPW
jgi:hypothetical protein